MMIKAYKYRVYPTKSQSAQLEQTLKMCRELYNAALEERIAAYKMAGKSVSDVGCSAFTNILSNKAEYAGRTVVKVNPNYTSQDCSICGHREKHLLSVREFRCVKCGALHQRDQNAAKNILARALPSSANVTVGNTYA